MNDDVFTTPDGKTYDMSVPNTAEGRVHEIAFVTRPKAPELMALFSRACFVLGRYLPDVQLGYLLAGQEASRRRAIVTIDLVPGLLATKDLKSNDTNRQALVDMDEQYNAVLERELRFKAALTYFQLKIKDMDSALNAVKKAVSDTDQIYNRPNYNQANTNMDSTDEALASISQPNPWPQDEWDFKEEKAPPVATTTTQSGFKIGKPRY